LYYGANEMSEGERKDFLAWYEKKKNEVLENRLAPQTY